MASSYTLVLWVFVSLRGTMRESFDSVLPVNIRRDILGTVIFALFVACT